jgi:hypothetical protein
MATMRTCELVSDHSPMELSSELRPARRHSNAVFPDVGEPFAHLAREQELLFALGRAGGLCDCGDEADEPVARV